MADPKMTAADKAEAKADAAAAKTLAEDLSPSADTRARNEPGNAVAKPEPVQHRKSPASWQELASKEIGELEALAKSDPKAFWLERFKAKQWMAELLALNARLQALNTN